MANQSPDNSAPDAFASAMDAAQWSFPAPEPEEYFTSPPVWEPVKRPRRKKVLWAIGIVILLMGMSAGGVYWRSQYLLGQFQAGDKKPIVSATLPELNVDPKFPANIGIKNVQTILAIGADKRYGEQGRGRSDTILLIRVDPTKKTVSMLSLPRDLRVPIPGYGVDRVNAAYSYGGPALLTKTLREYLGVPINHFVQIDFNGFSRVISNLGGVYLPIDGNYYHKTAPDPANNWASINVAPGYQKLGREDALSWVRFRHLDSDFYRAARQQIFIREVGSQLKRSVGDVGSLSGVLSVIAKATTSDLNSLGETAKLGNTLRSVESDHISRVTIEANGVTIGGGSYLEATTQQKNDALRTWANPSRVIARQQAPKKKSTQKKQLSTGRAALVSDGGRGVSLLKNQFGLPRCAPTQLPKGYRWPTSNQKPVRKYSLNGKPAIAAWATKSSGVSVLWMWTKWQSPPILDGPSNTISVGGKKYDLYYESGKLRMVAWRIDDSRVWITNTLRNELTNTQMLALARSCKSV